MVRPIDCRRPADASAGGELSVRPFPAVKAGPWHVATDARFGNLFWRRDGRELFYVNAQAMLMGVDVRPGPPFTSSTPKLLFDARKHSLVDITSSADGQRFLALRTGAAGTTGSTSTKFVVVQS